MIIESQGCFCNSLREDLKQGNIPYIKFQNMMWRVISVSDTPIYEHKNFFGEYEYLMEIEMTDLTEEEAWGQHGTRYEQLKLFY